MQQQGVIDDPDIEDVISLQDLSVDQLKVSCRLDYEVEDISAQKTTDHYDSDLQQLLINGAFYPCKIIGDNTDKVFYPYKVIGDNIDKKVKELCIMNENYDD